MTERELIAEAAFDKMINDLNSYLYEIDPAGTCCKENNVDDEYFVEAWAAAQHYSFESNPTDSLHKYLIDTLEDSFDGHFDEVVVEKAKIDKIEETWKKSHTKS